MGSLIAKLIYGPTREILMIGLDNAGKTSILLKTKSIDAIIPSSMDATLGFNVEHVQPCKGVRFVLWDLGGQKKMRPLWAHYYARAEGLIFVVDSNNRETIDEAREELWRVLEDASLKQVPLVVVANKLDLPTALTLTELIEKLKLNELDQSRSWTIKGTIATTGEGILEAMEAMSKFSKDYTKGKNSSKCFTCI